MNTTQALVQVKRGSNGRMSRYTPPAKPVAVKVVRITAQEFLVALKDSAKVIPGMDRDQATIMRQAAEKAAIESFVGYNPSILHATQLDAAKRKAQFTAKR